MIRKIVQDVVPKRSIRNIPVSPRETKKDDALSREREFLIERLASKNKAQVPVHKEIREEEEEVSGYTPPPRKKRKFFGISFKTLLFIVGLAGLVLAFGATAFFSGAVVTITPKHATVPINSTLSAYPDATSTASVLPYQVILMSKTDAEEVTGTAATTSVDKKASGKIIVYNNFSSESQTLIASTRFQTPEGLIYRIPGTIQVPGLTVKDGKSTPGSVEVTVIADQVGSKYNIGLTDFTLPGFKDDPTRATKIFARSKTEMTGGSAKGDLGGSAADIKAARAKIEARLTDALMRDIRAQKPADSVLYETAITIDFEMLPTTKKSETTVLVNEKATAHAVLINKKLLSRAILGDAIAAVGNEVEVRGIESLKFTPQTSANAKPIWQRDPLQFVITGSIDVVGIVNSEKLLNDLKGAPRSSLQTILAKYPTIEKANAVIRPFWKKSFPSDLTKLKIQMSTQ